MPEPAPPLRILFCNYEFPPLGGGAGTATLYLARELARRGHSLEVVTAGFPGLPKDDGMDGYRIRRLPSLRSQMSRCKPHEMLSYSILACLYLLFRRAPRPDIMVSFHSIPSGLAAWPISVLKRIPHIILFRGGDVPGNVPGKVERMHRMAYGLNRAIVMQSAQALANSEGFARLAEKAFPEKKVGVIRNGVDAEFYRPAAAPSSPSQPPNLLFVGRLCPEKALDVLIPALGAIARKMPDRAWKMIFVGDGSERQKTAEMARDCGIADRVEITGWKKREEIVSFYQKASLFLMPSRFEGMPNAVLEAMACGLPVIGTRISGTEELVQHGKTGLLVEPEDQQGLARAIEELMDDPLRCIEMGQAARSEIEEKWSWRRRAEELEDILRKAIASWRG